LAGIQILAKTNPDKAVPNSRHRRNAHEYLQRAFVWWQRALFFQTVCSTSPRESIVFQAGVASAIGESRHHRACRLVKAPGPLT
jgi:hypothetical protein